MRLLTMRPLGAAVLSTVLRGRSAPLLLGNVVQARYASVKTQGAYKKKPKKMEPKKMGAKRTGGQYVIPGNIIYKQRGSLWHPGENCMMGRNFNIHATQPGYVKYYRDPRKDSRRKYIGVTLKRDDVLPYPVNAARKRRLGMKEHRIAPVRHPYTPDITEATISDDHVFTLSKSGVTPADLLARSPLSPSGIPWQVVRKVKGEPDRILRLGKNYGYSEENWRLGQLVRTAQLSARKMRSRKAFFRHKRWRRERQLTLMRKMAALRAQEEAEETYKVSKKKMKAQKKTKAQKKVEKRRHKKPAA